MDRAVESALRFVSLTSSGLLAGSLGFGDKALIPGWEEERDREQRSPDLLPGKYFNAIGPIALASSMTLAVGANRQGAVRRTLDVVSSLALAGVLAATVFVTVPINKRLDTMTPADYPRDDHESMQKYWGRAHTLRTALGISAFVCAVLSNVSRPSARP
jgi:hypothetical protein